MWRSSTLGVLVCVAATSASGDISAGSLPTGEESPINASGHVLVAMDRTAPKGAQVLVPVYLVRGEEASDEHPSTIWVELRFDPYVLAFSGFDNPCQEAQQLAEWYAKGVYVNKARPGVIVLLIVGGRLEITTFDDQRPGGNPANQVNPLVVGYISFDVTGEPGETSDLEWTGLSMATPDAGTLTDAGAQNAVFTVGEFSDPDINGDNSIDAIDVQLVVDAALDLDIAPFSANIDTDGKTNAVDVQFVIAAALK